MVTPPWHNADFYLFVFNLFVFCCRFPTFLSRHKYTIKSEKQANPSESVKNKIGRNSLSYTLFFYPWLSLFTDAYFTSSKLATTDYQRLTEALVQIRNAISILNVINQQISISIRAMLFLFFFVLFSLFLPFVDAKVQKYFI